MQWDNPQLLDVGLRYRIDDSLTLVANTGWEDWSEFGRNQLGISAGPVSRVVTIDRNWKDTWSVGLGLLKTYGAHGYSIGVSYDSSPVNEADRTLDLPMDGQFKLSAAMVRHSEGSLNYALGSVGHWGHMHTRKNQYEADVTLEAVDGSWKITGLDLLEEQRIDPFKRTPSQ